MKLLIFTFLTYFSFAVVSAEKQIMANSVKGCWITNPCWYGSTKRPWNLPCELEITDSEIKWTQHDDSSKSFNLKYEFDENDLNNKTLIVYGGNDRVWYSHNTLKSARHKLIFKHKPTKIKNKGNMKLESYRWDSTTSDWHHYGSVHLRKNIDCKDSI